MPRPISSILRTRALRTLAAGVPTPTHKMTYPVGLPLPATRALLVKMDRSGLVKPTRLPNVPTTTWTITALGREVLRRTEAKNDREARAGAKPVL
jgi:hypothetical protein